MAASLTPQEARLLNLLQAGVPLVERPFAELGTQVGLGEAEVLERIAALKAAGIVRQISAIFDTRSLGYRSSLVAMRVAPARENEAAAILNRHPGISHNYRRNHAFNIWFTLAVPPTSRLGLEGTVEVLHRLAQADSTRILPTLKLYKIGVKLDMTGETPPDAASDPPAYTQANRKVEGVTPEQIAVIRELQQDMPLVPTPYSGMAERLGLSLDALFAAARQMLDSGQLRRIAAVLHHRRAGFRANAMGVWKVPEERIDEVGDLMSNFNAVSHCYRRPVYPDWPYALFTMVHGRTRLECEATLAAMSRASGITEYEALYSTREYKKVRLSYFTPELDEWEAEVLAREPAAREVASAATPATA
ncbi:MAG TPA: Lrp/AsnC family transcriptional regulator [Thermodesulfobacteriota bacterium]|nr:Lrp/AsnC family transcriptional regulator [Thermodesulfobacteriota bacterium]